MLNKVFPDTRIPDYRTHTRTAQVRLSTRLTDITPMRILLINSRYFQAAGPERYLFNIKATLEDHGHTVIPFSLKNARNIDSPYSTYFAENVCPGDELYFEDMEKSLATASRLLARQFYSVHVRRRLEALIADTRPDIAYILHYQNRLSPSVIDACKNNRIPCVLRISDFSLTCINNHLLRAGKVCELCINGSLLNGVRYKCAKGSYTASLIKTAGLYFHRLRNTFENVDRVVVPSRFTMNKLSSVLNPEKMSYLPTLVQAERRTSQAVGQYALFVGRVEEEKGLEYAIEAFANSDYPLKIVGYSHSGYGDYLQDSVRVRNISNVEFMGPKFGDELTAMYRNCRFVIAPGIWYENLPNVVLEAMAHGKPVAASQIGSIPEVVIPEHTGLLFKPRSSAECRQVITRLFENDSLCRELGDSGYKRVVDYYSPAKHYESLVGIFSSILKIRSA